MSDLERRLEDLFMSDSRARRVERVNAPPSRRGRLAPFAFLGAVSLGTLALVVAFTLVRGGRENVPASTPSGAAVVASSSPSTSPAASESVMCGQITLFSTTPTGGGFFVVTPKGQ